MIYSMTGFARHTRQFGDRILVWELRSVNHRYLDLRLQLPESAREHEAEIRRRCSSALSRGRIEAQLRMESDPQHPEAAMRINDAQAKSLISTLKHIDQLMVNGARVSALDILRWPGVLISEPEHNPTEVQDAILAGLDAALHELQQMRQHEGEMLHQHLLTRLEKLSARIVEVRARRPEVLALQRERLMSRIAELDLSLDAQRLEQEVVLLAQRLDVDEELDRLEGHITALQALFVTEEPVGRRLDFLMQELQREANTLSSKSQDLETTQAAVDMKVWIEQMREQIQNIE